jgi:putative transposase
MPRLRHYDHLGTARFVTFSCYHRYQLLTSTDDIRTVLSVLSTVREKHKMHILGYVIMPEHVHLVIVPPDGAKLGTLIGELKSCSARAILAEWRECDRTVLRKLTCESSNGVRYQFWQPRCYDHNCRSPETVLEKINYCHENPVKRRLVLEPGEWRWSSYRWYHGLDGVELEIDGYEV